MPRILGVDIPNDKPTHIALRYLYGILYLVNGRIRMST